MCYNDPMKSATPIVPNRNHVSDEIIYPDSDGKPVAESDYQLTPLVYAVYTLRDHFKDRPDVYVAADMLLYYEEGNPKASVAPDVFVTKGLDGNYPRNSFKLWVEGNSPSLIIEILSKGTAKNDLQGKKQLYQQLGVEEYILYDPVGGLMEPALQGFRLDEGVYRPIPLVKRSGWLAIDSEQADLELHLIDDEDGEYIRFFSPFNEEYLQTYNETKRDARVAKRDARVAKQDARVAKQELEREREENERLRAKLRALGHDV